jgi:microcystin-dependent protein
MMATASNMMQQVLQAMMPVGYVFEWAPVDGNALDLSTADKVRAYFGFGTWEAVSTFLLGASDDHPAGDTGGEETHTLTVEEIPALRLCNSDQGYFWKSKNGVVQSSTTSGWYRGLGSWDNGDDNVRTEGGDQPHNNMPPYTSVYIWKRTA